MSWVSVFTGMFTGMVDILQFTVGHKPSLRQGCDIMTYKDSIPIAVTSLMTFSAALQLLIDTGKENKYVFVDLKWKKSSVLAAGTVLTV